MKRVKVRKIPDVHGTKRVWMVQIPNQADWWTHYYLKSFDAAMTLVREYLKAVSS